MLSLIWDKIGLVRVGRQCSGHAAPDQPAARALDPLGYRVAVVDVAEVMRNARSSPPR